MDTTLNYQRIARAIEFINENFKSQPTLDEIAEHVHLSPFHFQKLFTDWAGVSPKKFLQYTTLNYAKNILRQPQVTLFDAAEETGLSGTSRLHDLFIKIEGMTPGEYKNGGEKLSINYSFYDSLFGKLLIGSTTKGICYLMFSEEANHSLDDLKNRFPKAEFVQKEDDFQKRGVAFFTSDWHNNEKLKLHLKGTDFQLKVWESLLKVPLGKLSTYGNIAEELKNPNASRAVGKAIGCNPVAFLIPCHRVIQTSGKLGGYMWGTTRKQAIIGWEAAKISIWQKG
jgi:AraC family transcriptional regulator of adaptative response/methylated-DNA-[protein]-cysteine methyltransferase